MGTWTEPSWRPATPSDPVALAALPNALQSLVERFAGIWLDGALHIRGARDEPAWHSIRTAWHGPDGVGARHGLPPSDIPFAETTFGDQLILRDRQILRIVAETGAIAPLGLSVGGLIAEVERDAVRLLALDPARRRPAAEWEELLAFWFEDCGRAPERIGRLSERWFAGGPAFDTALAERFEPLLARAEAGDRDVDLDLHHWERTPRGTLARVLVLDQLPRNLRRGDPRAFALDARARAVARAAIERGVDQRLHAVEAVFLYLPLEHSERVDDQHRCVDLFERLEGRAPEPARGAFARFTDFARRHRAVIERFGRFPHRNAILGRRPSSEEDRYLAGGGGGDRF
jgi:uncharacterized protein (DUF924 family)